MHSMMLQLLQRRTETPFILFGCALFAAALFVYVFYQPGEVEAGEGQDALRLSAGAQGRDLRKPARPELRVQGRQAERSRITPCSAPRWKTKRRRFWRRWRAIEKTANRGEGRPGVRTQFLLRFASGHGFSRADRSHLSGFAERLRPRGAPSSLRTLRRICRCRFAQNITGTVTNGTTGKPAAGDEVTLLSLSQGMQEVGSTKTDAQGKFSLAAPADQRAPHMVRVTHGGVNYFPRAAR